MLSILRKLTHWCSLVVKTYLSPCCLTSAPINVRFFARALTNASLTASNAFVCSRASEVRWASWYVPDSHASARVRASARGRGGRTAQLAVTDTVAVQSECAPDRSTRLAAPTRRGSRGLDARRRRKPGLDVERVMDVP